ncbi:hypothetical protein [Clostridium perfringens]|nr:hypothetical protein [Clostridium perfringens]
MLKISLEEYNNKPRDYKGDHPELKGKRTLMVWENGTKLLIEGLHFEII